MDATLRPVLLPGTKASRGGMLYLNTRLTYFLSVIHLSVGCVCVAVQIGMLTFLYWEIPPLSRVYHGFWCGAGFIVTGLIGIVAGLTRNYYAVLAFAVMSLMSAVSFVLPLLVLSIMGFVSLGVHSTLYSAARQFDQPVPISHAEQQGARRIPHLMFFNMAVMEAIATLYSFFVTITTLLQEKQATSHSKESKVRLVLLPQQGQSGVLKATISTWEDSSTPVIVDSVRTITGTASTSR